MDDEAVARVRALVDERVTKGGCPFCDSERWVPVEGLVGLMVSELTPAGEGGPAAGAEADGVSVRRLSSVAWICWNCGYLRAHFVPGEVFEEA